MALHQEVGTASTPRGWPDDLDLGTAPLPGDALHRLLADARAHPGLPSATLLGLPVRLVTRHAEVRSLLLDDDAFAGGTTYQVQLEPVVGPTFISMDGPEHHLYRRLATPAFRSRRIRRFVETELEPLAHEVVDGFVGEGGGDLVELFARVLPFRVISRKLGLPRGSEGGQRRLALQMLSYPATPDVALRAAQDVGALVQPVLEEARRRPGGPDGDVLSGLAHARQDGVGLDDEEVASHVRLLYAVGATTTSDGLSNLLHHVLRRPELLRRAAAEPDLVARLVHEVLRLEPPVSLLPRVAVGRGRVGDEVVEAGTLLLAGLAGANRDPALVGGHAVDELDPDRPESSILTFGIGSKFCPGAQLGRLQLETALRVVLERLDDLTLVETAEPAGAILRSTSSVVATWRPRARA
jgi:cytochrome P450